ncbi:dockerin type I domain-containing protein [Paenibacillus thalictri]|uniref:Dockerin domain-containing protein n=1 Tax=Paenibacillus thalictri TaxID=2527873 RepID=A0A4Q9DV46_9BACL|nr:dockerin type I domain-containing protein [Paenibacillus thalictri]TBL79468.1 hypothetical protein EYB31_11190 [Paenibacillus thalictri]
MSIALAAALSVFAFPAKPTEAAASWAPVGSAGFSSGKATDISLTVDNGVPYIAYRDANVGNKATVMKYDGTGWVQVGTPGFSTAGITRSSLAIVEGVPYIAFSSGWPTVMTYDGTNWVPVGSAAIDTVSTNSTSLAMKDGMPYVAYSDLESTSQKITVKRFDGTNWVPVGTPKFAYGDTISLKMNNGTPYMAYRDLGDWGRATVKMFDGTNWVQVGPAVSNDNVSHVVLTFVNGTPYIAYTDSSNGNKTEVKSYNGTSWEYVGSGFLSSGNGAFNSFATNNNGDLYIAFTDFGNGTKAKVMKLVGTDWVKVGDSDISANKATYISLTLDGNIPYVAYSDDGSGGAATVMTFQDDATYTLGAITDKTASVLAEGYSANTQEVKTIILTNTGTGKLTHLTAALSGANAADFVLTPPAGSLNSGASDSGLTIKAKDGLAAGTYTATVTVTADHMTNVTFTVTQVVNRRKGDVNGDGLVTPADGLYISRYMNGQLVLSKSGPEFQILDMNNDGELDAMDIRMLMNLYLGVAQ